MPTENASERFAQIERWSTLSAVTAMFETQLAAIAATGSELATIARAAESIARWLAEGGRLIYAGAGTSGRIAVQDGVELGPTFGWPAERVAYALAGGDNALTRSVEFAEDDKAAARQRLQQLGISRQDVLIGVSASGRTPYTVSAMETANQTGALTIGVTSNTPCQLLTTARIGICAVTGGEVIAGSTRMKAGTAQKAILNMLSTATMIRCGRVCRGLMVDMVVSNKKLQERAVEIVERLANVDSALAATALDAAEGNIKIAVLCALGVDRQQAGQLLAQHQGVLSDALGELEQQPAALEPDHG